MNDQLDDAFHALDREVGATVRPLTLGEVERRAHRRRRARYTIASGAAAIAVVGAGVGTWVARDPTSSGPVLDPVTSPTTGVTSPPSSPNPAPPGTASATLPASGPTGAAPKTTTDTIDEAISVLNGHTGVPLLAPTSIPDTWAVKAAVLSGTVRATGSTYEVDLYRCPVPMPLNDPRIGNLDCGGDAQFYGFFGGRTELSAASAQAALPSVVHQAPDTVTCSAGASPTNTSIAITAEVTATALTCPDSGNPVLVKWTQHGWTIIEDFGQGGDANWHATAQKLMEQVANHQLPSGPGLFEILAAGDGNHAELGWTVGSTLYTAYNDHSEIDAAALASSMQHTQ